jgi:hypothetical protein
MSYSSLIMKVVMIGWIEDVGKMFTTLKDYKRMEFGRTPNIW